MRYFRTMNCSNFWVIWEHHCYYYYFCKEKNVTVVGYIIINFEIWVNFMFSLLSIVKKLLAVFKIIKSTYFIHTKFRKTGLDNWALCY